LKRAKQLLEKIVSISLFTLIIHDLSRSFSEGEGKSIPATEKKFHISIIVGASMIDQMKLI
jgi:hypothetical protein